MKVVGYIRVSTNKQDVENQRFEVNRYAETAGIVVDQWVSVQMSTKKDMVERKINELIDMLDQGDTLLVSEQSRLSRDVIEAFHIIYKLKEKNIKVIFIKEGIIINGKIHFQEQMRLGIGGILGASERELIGQRTRQALARLKAEGKQLGRPIKSKLDLHKQEIEDMLKQGLTQTTIASKFDVTRQMMSKYIKSRLIK